MRFRSRLGWWLNALGHVGSGAEIGVGTGRFAERLLDTWNGKRLYLIDAWRHLPGYRDTCNVSDELMERRFRLTKRRVARFRSRSVILRMLSREAAARVGDSSLDFVYIDANHAYRAVRDDLTLWYPKLKEGGVLAGHDYYDAIPLRDGRLIIRDNLPRRRLTSYGVRTAVDEFARRYGLEIGCTQETAPTWYAFKRRTR